jgi:transposase
VRLQACRALAFASVTGRPSTLTPEIAGQIVRLVRAGNFVVTACGTVGVPRSTFYAWLARGDSERADPADAAYRQFRADVEQARADAEARLVLGMAQAARNDDIEAAITTLETVYPEHWAPVRRTPSGRVVRAWTRPPDPFDEPGDDPLDAA